MADILFTYPRNSKSLTIETGANQISWSYNLITQAYPTYGGEVVQVLSTNIDVLTIQGEIKNYTKMEEIYGWFLFYMQDATQGVEDKSGYHEDPVTMFYAERGWTLKIQPIALPGMQYGTEIVVPTWQLQAHVIDPDPEMTDLTIQENVEGKQTFRNLTADIGFHVGNLFSDPLGKPYNKYEKNLIKDTDVDLDPQNNLSDVAKKLNQALNSYLQSDFKNVMENFENISGPADPPAKKDDPSTSTKPGKTDSSSPTQNTPSDKSRPIETKPKTEYVSKSGQWYKSALGWNYYYVSGRWYIALDVARLHKLKGNDPGPLKLTQIDEPPGATYILGEGSYKLEGQ
jgi:hypothetical protein